MIKSMTGFASVTVEDDRATVAVTIRSLNHRYLDLQLRIPQSLAAIESDVRGLVALDTMRSREGDDLRADLDGRRGAVADLVERIATAADDGRGAVERRLAERVRELRADLSVDEAAVAQEIVRIAARSDISEEVARFRAHVRHWAALAAGDEPCGRKLDFLLQ